MNLVRLAVPLSPAERDALKELAGQELRRTEAQAAWLIRRELERRGLLANTLQPAGHGAGRAEQPAHDNA